MPPPAPIDTKNEELLNKERRNAILNSKDLNYLKGLRRE